MIGSISTTIQKLNKQYKPLGVAVFLAVGGLLAGMLWSSLFASASGGIIQEKRTPGGPRIIPQAEGAQVDSAALMPQSAPFLALADIKTNPKPVENSDLLYGEGAIVDAGPVLKTKTTAPITSGPSNQLVAGVIYTVVSGDTIASIASEFNIPIDIIVEFNPSVNFSSLVPGISVVIPNQNDILSFSR